MVGAEQLPNDLQNALDKGVLKRLPLTFLPFVNQQLKQWNNLFPNERRAVENLLLYVASLSPEESSGLFREVIELEEKMGVRRWQFSTNEQTIQNSSQLARSPYFQEWRLAVQTVFDAADRNAQEPGALRSRQAIDSSFSIFLSRFRWMRRPPGNAGRELVSLSRSI